MNYDISTIGYAILGLLSWRALSGYDLKGMFAGSVALHWSGNNNQIYKTLVELHRANLVDVEVETKETGPARKVYRITEAGVAALRAWVITRPEPPQLRHQLLMQLAWADQLTQAELNALLDEYEGEVRHHLAMLQTQERNLAASKANTTYINTALARTSREAFLWRMIWRNWMGVYENELNWLRQVRDGLTLFNA